MTGGRTKVVRGWDCWGTAGRGGVHGVACWGRSGCAAERLFTATGAKGTISTARPCLGSWRLALEDGCSPERSAVQSTRARESARSETLKVGLL